MKRKRLGTTRQIANRLVKRQVSKGIPNSPNERVEQRLKKRRKAFQPQEKTLKRFGSSSSPDFLTLSL